MLNLPIAKGHVWFFKHTVYAEPNMLITQTFLLVFVFIISFPGIGKNWWLTPIPFSSVQERDELEHPQAGKGGGKTPGLLWKR